MDIEPNTTVSYMDTDLDLGLGLGVGVDQLSDFLNMKLRLNQKHCAMCKIRKADTKSLFDPNLCKSCQVHFCHYRGC